MSIWNNLAGVIGDLLDPEFEERKRKAEFDPTKPMAWDVPQSGADSLPDSPSVNPSLRRMFSKGGFSSDEPVDPIFARAGRVSDAPLTTPEPTGSPYEGDPTHSLGGRPMASPDELKPPSMSPLPRRASEISREALQTALANRQNDLGTETTKSRKTSFWNRLGGGALHGVENFLSGGGGEAGILGDVLMGGLGEGFDPKRNAERKQNKRLAKMFGQYNQDLSVEEADRKSKMAETKYVQERYKPLLEGFGADDRIDEDEAAIMSGLGIPVAPYDARQFDTTEVGGVSLSAPKKGVPNYRTNPTLPIDQGKARTDTKFTAGGKEYTLPLTPREQVDALVGAADREERTADREYKREEAAADKEYKDETEYRDDLRGWSGRQTSARAKKAGASAALSRLTASRADLAAQGLPTVEIDRQIANMEQDVAAADEMLKEPKPKKVIRKKVGGSKGKFSQADIDRVINGRK